jgi:ribose transport system permease protein
VGISTMGDTGRRGDSPEPVTGTRASRLVPDTRREQLQKAMKRAGVVPALVLVFLFGVIFVPGFTNGSNLLDTVQTASVIGMLAIGQAFVIIGGGAGVDLSVGATVALASVVGAHLANDGAGWLILGVLATGFYVGLVNGIGVAYAGMQPFIMTLATLTIARGAASYTSSANQITLTGSAGLPWLSNTVAGVPVPIIVFVGFALIGQILIAKTVFGRQIYLMGGNEEAARFAGVPIAKRRVLLYVFSGLCAGIAALLLMSRLGTADPTFANGYELASIAAVVVGGAPLTGGQGSIAGAAVGVLIIQIITNVLSLLNVNSFIQQIITGLIVIVVVGLNRRGRESATRDFVKAIPLAIALLVGLFILFNVLGSTSLGGGFNS